MNQKEHWKKVYLSKPSTEVSWYQPHLNKSLELITQTGLDKKGRIIDVGGGASTLAEDLSLDGYNNLIVLDISLESLQKSKERMGERADMLTWIEADILKVDFPENSFDVWHDRAVFHFLTNPEDRKKYIKTLTDSLKHGGYLIMATFSLEGPFKCSGLDVVRYSPEILSRELGDGFSLVKNSQELHQTPFGTFQNFTYCLFRRN